VALCPRIMGVALRDADHQTKWVWYNWPRLIGMALLYMLMEGGGRGTS
jgi:hypothetical protein